MTYLVTTQQELFDNPVYEIIGVDESLSLLSSCKLLQYDSETTGIDCHLDRLLCMQFGNDDKDIRVVVDCSTVSPLVYKDILESKYLVGQNLKFDLQFLYCYGIIPRKIYDTMIVEQLLYLGYPSSVKSYSLHSIAMDRLGIDIDKTVRGQIIWRGLDTEVIKYAAGDVTYLEKIMQSQLEECKTKECTVGAKLECDFVPTIAYLEWCGIKLDEDRWKLKMKNDQEALENAIQALNAWFVEQADTNYPEFKKYIFIDRQGDLFSGFDLTPRVSVNWSSSTQVIPIVKALGFNTVIQDKKTGEDKDSVLEKKLKTQKGINDTFLDLYIAYSKSFKLTTSFGQGHLDIINPKTGRIHTKFKQIGASSGRMSCGGGENSSVARAKHLSIRKCKNPNLQQLPHDEFTRSCFIAEPGNLFLSCDFSSEEARLSADIYNDDNLLDIFRKGIDSHSMYAKIFFKDELKDIDVQDVERLRSDLRTKAKGPEFN